jgi:hypothetical protein
MEMLTMTQIDSIRKMYYEQGKNISEISKITENDRKTIRNYIGKDDWNSSPPPAPGTKDRYAKLSPYKAVSPLDGQMVSLVLPKSNTKLYEHFS